VTTGYNRLAEIEKELYDLATRRHKGKDEYNRMQELLKERDRLQEKKMKGGQ